MVLGGRQGKVVEVAQDDAGSPYAASDGANVGGIMEMPI